MSVLNTVILLRLQKLLKNKYEDLDTESKEESRSESEPDSAVPTVVGTGTAESGSGSDSELDSSLLAVQCLGPRICFWGVSEA